MRPGTHGDSDFSFEMLEIPLVPKGSSQFVRVSDSRQYFGKHFGRASESR